MKLALRDLSIEIRISVLKNRVILGHETQGETRAELNKQTGEGIDGIGDLSGEDQVPHQDASRGRTGLRAGDSI